VSPPRLTTDLVDSLAPLAAEAVERLVRGLPGVHYADLRLEVTQSRWAAAEDGAPRASGEEAALGLGARVLAADGSVAPGYAGRRLGAGDLPRLGAVIEETLRSACRRAGANARAKAQARGKWGPLGEALEDTRLAPVRPVRDRVPAEFETDPREVSPEDLVRLATDVSRQVGAADPRIVHQAVAVTTGLARELFASSEGALIDQARALTQGSCTVVARGSQATQQLWDVLGHQRGLEILLRGADDPAYRFPPLAAFCLGLAREAALLAEAPPAPTLNAPAVVVTDPHYNTLLAHEIIGHPTELDRALKMETAYAGRSWLLAHPGEHQVGRRIASPLVTAFSDPALPGYGHYRYDHDGAPGRRVVHIDRGVFTGFMNSRQTAALFAGEPNGHYTATEACLTPLVRMSTTVFAGGDRDPEEIIGEVDRGWYLAGHRIPSIAESRENFRISARRVYAIERGQLGRLYRDGGIAADTRDFLMHVDAVGRDFRLYPIPNCGKGQPMQVKRLGNGGPTLRSRARLTGSG
jgi:TldD protein